MAFPSAQPPKERKYQYEKDWDPAETEIEWQKKGREKLNQVIAAYNQWQVMDFSPGQWQTVYALIQWGKQTFADQEGGSGWREVLDRMEKFLVENKDTDGWGGVKI